MITGGNALRSRVKAVGGVFKPMGRLWADRTVEHMKPRVPYRTGRLRQSIRRRSATQRKASVEAHYTAFFVDAGTKRHTIVPKKAGTLVFPAGGRTVFAKKVDHPATHPQPFRDRATLEGMRRTPQAKIMIDLWNRAKAAR